MFEKDLGALDNIIIDAIYLSLKKTGKADIPFLGSFFKQNNKTRFEPSQYILSPQEPSIDTPPEETYFLSLLDFLLKSAIQSYVYQISILPERVLFKDNYHHAVSNIEPALSQILLRALKNISAFPLGGEIYPLETHFFSASKPLCAHIYIKHPQPPAAEVPAWLLADIKHYAQNPSPVVFVVSPNPAARHTFVHTLHSFLMPLGPIYSVSVPPEEAFIDLSHRPEKIIHFTRPVSYKIYPLLKALANPAKIILADSALPTDIIPREVPHFNIHLAPKLCGNCKIKEPLSSAKTIDSIKKMPPDILSSHAINSPEIYSALGCDHCQGTGTNGNLLLFSSPESHLSLEDTITLSMLSGLTPQF